MEVEQLRAFNKVRFVKPSEPVTWSTCKAEYAALLEDGKIYTLERVDMHDWHTRFYLQGFQGIAFNSVWFEMPEEQKDA